MESIRITDNKQEIIQIGRNIFETNPKIYNAKVLESMNKVLGYYFPDVKSNSAKEKFFESIYNYWVYGVSIKQFFFYRFAEKTHKEKSKYLTDKNRIPYIYYLNNSEDWHLLENKYEAYTLLKEFYHRDIIKISNRRDYSIFCEFVNKHHEFIVKPGRLGCSIGVYKDCIDNYDDMFHAFESLLETGKEYKDKYCHWKHVEVNQDVVIEEIIKEDERISVLHPFSLNPLRVTTIRTGDNVCFFFPRISIGNRGSFITNASVGALIAGINADNGIVETNGLSEFCEEYEVHPISQVRIKGFSIPRWNEMKTMLTEAANRLSSIRYVGWDVVLSNKGWCIIEGNFMGEFTGQVVYNRGFKSELEEIIGWRDDKEFWWKK